PQDREFHAVTLCLLVIFALPGFICHVELKHQLARERPFQLISAALFPGQGLRNRLIFHLS
ncbi:DUF2818 family protein, partial [Gammaproteobacteria bacterium]|nr:DUF2818 family protein [Gammaproteobacteria bacterium]